MSIRKYWSFFRIRFINGLQYRTAAYAGIATQFAWGGMRILLFRAFYMASPADFPMDFQALASYLWLEQAFLTLFSTWMFDNAILNAITSGDIAYELARPIDLYGKWFLQNLSMRFSRAALRCMPILLVGAFLPRPYGLALPANVGAFPMFLLTSFLGVCVNVAFLMLVYISTFYTLDYRGVRMVMIGALDFLTGSLIPLPFFPDWLRNIIELTPLGATMNLPLRIYSGDIAGDAMVRGFLVQVTWLVLLLLFGKLWMSRALKRVVVQGG